MAGFVMTACGLGGPFGGSVDSKASGRSDASTRPAARIVSEHLPPDLVDQLPPTAMASVLAVDDIESLIGTERVNCRIDQPVPLPVQPRCHEVTVPETWGDPDSGRTVTLQVAVFAGSGSESDAIAYLDGGPGGHTLDNLVFSFRGLVEPLLGSRDFIVYDQRGVGTSEPQLDCPELTETNLADMMGAIAADDVLDATLSAQEACASRLQDHGVDLSAYNSIASANDLEALRIALGYDRLNPIGISYGTRLAQTYLRMYPDSVRSLTLDSVFPTAADLWTDFDRSVERSFRQLFDGCADSPECAAAYPNFEDDFFRLLDRLDADPAPVTFTNLRTGVTTPSRLTGDDVLAFAFQALYSRSAFALLPQMTVDGLDGDYRILEALGSSVITSLGFFSVGMQLSVECNEEIPFESATDRVGVQSEDPRYRRLERLSESGDFFDLCPSWPSGEAPPVENELVVSDVPTLLLGGQYDPITPPSGMGLIAAGLTTTYQFLFPHEGHGVAPTPCGAEIVARFIDDPSAQPDSSCISRSPAPDWVAETAAEIDLVEFETDGPTAMRGVRPDGWTDTGFGSFARLANAVDQTAVVFQPTQGIDAEFLASTLGRQLNFDMTEIDPLTIDGESWRRFSGSRSGVGTIEVMISPGRNGVIAALIARPEELDSLRELVLIPGARAAEPL
ncbi:MAG: alpha/beta hydrolase, partial [Acidimicrobiia bacterium]|nr:alpha/beta hydrolase [Acidimicrobiia bacterium]